MSKQAVRERFAQENGFTMPEAYQIITAADQIKRYGEAECNGDPHPCSGNISDKNENAKNWGAQRDIVIVRLEGLASPRGFTVELNGLRPSLKKADLYVEIPE